MGIQFCGSTLWKHSPSRSPGCIGPRRCSDDPEINALATNDVFWDTIVEIGSFGEQDVYDGTVSGTHNFVVNGITAHNSLWNKMRTSLFLLNRPDAFDRDDPRGGEADFILAKHRNGPTKTVTVAHQLHLTRFANLGESRPSCRFSFLMT